MSTLLSTLGLAALVVSLVGLAKGDVRRVGLIGRTSSVKLLAAAVALLAVAGALAPSTPNVPAPALSSSESEPAPPPAASAVTSPESVPAESPSASRSPSPAAATVAGGSGSTASISDKGRTLLFLAAGGDGDSWRDTGGVEYRMGLVNAPEYNECGGAAATAYRRRRLADGFSAQSYATDRYGRKVSVIFTASGVNLNVAMARAGMADDRYLARYRDENPTLARQLDTAFARAKADRAGIWGRCSPGGSGASRRPAAQPVARQGGGCHPDYRTCIPIKGDGSGNGDANDLDCGDIGTVVYLRRVGRDPYRLDKDGDGVGCESYG